MKHTQRKGALVTRSTASLARRKRSLVVILAVVGLVAGMVTSAPTATAADPYTGKSPWTVYGSFRCLDSQVRVGRLDLEDGDAVYGTLSIWRSNVCNSYWATLDLPWTMPRGRRANTWLFRFYHGEPAGSWGCDVGEGSGMITAGKRSCYTFMIYAPSPSVLFGASATFEYWDGSRWHVYFSDYYGNVR
jgi:hypothetical protein